MKPRNFPGRRALRRERALARTVGMTRPAGDPTVVDINFRVGAGARGPDGIATMRPDRKGATRA